MSWKYKKSVKNELTIGPSYKINQESFILPWYTKTINKYGHYKLYLSNGTQPINATYVDGSRSYDIAVLKVDTVVKSKSMKSTVKRNCVCLDVQEKVQYPK